MTRLVCISDLHLGDEFEGYSGYEWLDDFLSAVVDAEDTDHLLVCGDLTGQLLDPAEASDIDDFRTLCTHYDFLTGRHATVLPGNHDYLRAGILDRTLLRNAFTARLSTLFRGRRSKRRFPTYQLLEGIAVVGLDTNTPTKLPKAHLGCIGDDQLDELARILALPSVHDRQVVLAMHHGPYGTVHQHLVDVDALFDVVDDTNVDMIVFGHDHSSYEDEVNGIPVACVGGFMDDDGYALVIDSEDGTELDWFWWTPEEWE